MLVAQLLKKANFLSVATADKNGSPNVVPKFLVKFENSFIYLIDYSFATTIQNLKSNPKASLSLMDSHNLEAYRLNGSVELIEKGDEFDRLAEEVEGKTIRLSVDRVIESCHTGQKHEHYALEIPDKFVVIKFKIEEATKIGVHGEFYRENELE